MTKPYSFVNPLDHVDMRFETLDEAIAAAEKYLGKEDAFCETVERIAILHSHIARVVVWENPGPDGERGEAA